MPVNVFGEGAVQTAYVGYKKYTLTADTILFWPSSYIDTPNITAAYIEIEDATPGLTLTLPDATQVSVGQNIIISNTGTETVDLLNNNQGPLGSIVPGLSYYYILTDNSTRGGVWKRDTFAAGTADIDAVELAGLGLAAAGGKLTTNVPILTTIGPVYNVTALNNAGLLVWQGGSGNIILPPVADVPDGFYFSLNNDGTGEIIISGDVPIDNQNQFFVTLNQSLTLIKGTANWYTVGFGQQASYAVSLLNRNVAGDINVNLTIAEAQRTIQQYTGVLTGNITVFFPIQINEWTVYNGTTGPFTLSIQLAGGAGTAYVIPQGQAEIFYSDGSTLRKASEDGIPAGPGAGAMLYYNGSGWISLPAGNPNTAMVMSDSGTAPTWNGFSTLQIVSNVNSTSSSIAVDVAPATVTDLSIVVTPSLITNTVKLEINFSGACTTLGEPVYLSLYRGATELCKFATYYNDFNGYAFSSSLVYYDVPGAGVHNYTIKASSAEAGTLYINRDSTGATTGLISSIHATEIGGT